MQYVYVIFILIVVFAAAYYVSVFLAKKAGNLSSGKYMDICDRVFISNDKQLIMVKVSNVVVVLAVCKDNVTTVCQLDEADIDWQDQYDTEQTSIDTFKGILSSFTSRSPKREHDESEANDRTIEYLNNTIEQRRGNFKKK